MDDSAMYGNHAAVNNHSMGNILGSSVPFGYSVADSFAPVSHDMSEDMCDILQQIISISSQSLDEAQMRSDIHTRVRTDIGTDTGPHLVHCRSAQCRSISVDQHWSNCTSN